MPGPTNTGGTRLHKQSFTQSAADHEVERLAWQPWVGGGFTFSLMVTGLFSWPQLRSSMPPPDPAQVEVASRSLCFVDRLMGTWSKLEQPDLLALLCCSSKALNHARPCRCVCPSSKDPMPRCSDPHSRTRVCTITFQERIVKTGRPTGAAASIRRTAQRWPDDPLTLS